MSSAVQVVWSFFSGTFANPQHVCIGRHVFGHVLNTPIDRQGFPHANVTMPDMRNVDGSPRHFACKVLW
jgi:hypothetical protein